MRRNDTQSLHLSCCNYRPISVVQDVLESLKLQEFHTACYISYSNLVPIPYMTSCHDARLFCSRTCLFHRSFLLYLLQGLSSIYSPQFFTLSHRNELLLTSSML
jgi:hypothetical protein